MLLPFTWLGRLIAMGPAVLFVIPRSFGVATASAPVFTRSRMRLHVQSVTKVRNPVDPVPKSQRKHAATFVPPPPSLFERFKSTSLYKILYEVEWKRWLFGDFLVPYTSRRIIKLKERDNVPLLTDLVYNFRLEGTLRIAFFLTNVVTVAGIVGVINWYMSGFEVQKVVVDRHAQKIPLRLESRQQYAIMLCFAAFLSVALNILRRRVILRCYYDGTKNQFTILTVDGIGRTKPFYVNAGSGKEVRAEGVISSLLGNIAIVDDSGKVIRKFVADRDSFLFPWYYNRLMGYDTKERYDQTPLTKELKKLNFYGNKQRMAEELSALNAKKMEENRN